MLIQESFLNNSVTDAQLEIQGYNLHRFDRQISSGKNAGGGLCAYSAKNGNVEQLVDLNVCSPDLEAQWLKLTFPETRPTYIVNIYKPPTGNVEGAFNKIQETMQSLQTNSLRDYVVMGDVNVDLLKPSANKKTVTNFMNNMGL